MSDTTVVHHNVELYRNLERHRKALQILKECLRRIEVEAPCSSVYGGLAVIAICQAKDNMDEIPNDGPVEG